MKKNYTDLGLLVIRLFVSAMMLSHGIPKIKMLFVDPIKFSDPLGIGSTTSLILTLIGEVIAPILIIIGYKTKLAAIPATITMFVAAFVVHANDGFGVKEKALLFLVSFLAIFLTGPGRYSIDLMHKR